MLNQYYCVVVFYHHADANGGIQPRSSPALMGGLMGGPVVIPTSVPANPAWLSRRKSRIESATWCNFCHQRTLLGVGRWTRWNSFTYDFGPLAWRQYIRLRLAALVHSLTTFFQRECSTGLAFNECRGAFNEFRLGVNRSHGFCLCIIALAAIRRR